MTHRLETPSRLGYTFMNPELYWQALTHQSWVNEQAEKDHKNYQTLEFLGDSILKAIQSTYLYEKESHLGEGHLTQARAKMENNYTLATWSRQLGLDQLIRHGKSVNAKDEKAWSLICAQVFEAMIGAIWTDCGKDFIWIYKIYLKWNLTCEMEDQINYKKEVQEWLQSQGFPLPNYQVIKSTGPSHQRHFTVECQLPNFNKTVVGEGSSIKSATVATAKVIYETLMT